MLVCMVESCDSEVMARGLCAKHYRKFERCDPGFKTKYPTRCHRPCIIDGCEGTSRARGLCQSHYTRIYYQENKGHIKKDRKYSLEVRYSDLKCKRGASFSFEEYKLLVSNPCHYCGGSLPISGAGLDRKDSEQGYYLDNVVPCCWPCNDTKGHRMSYEEMVNLWKFRREQEPVTYAIGHS